MKFRDFLRILAAHGFAQARQRGSHRIYQGMVGGKTRVVVIAYHSEGDDIAPGTLQSMIRQSGLDKRLFR
ncbi:MAG: type II toxin-antitoxin system HicA family toxin [Rhodospirillales bacterium]